MSLVDNLIDRYNDLDRRMGRRERLDVNPPVASAVTYSGTPTAGAVAYWAGAGTVVGAGTVFYDSTNGRLGIGASDPASQLEVTAATTAATRGFITGQHNSSAAAALFYFQKSRNTRASPNSVNNGDFGGVFYWQLHDGTNYLATASIAAKANGTVATGSIPTDIVISAGATDDLGLANERMRIRSTGEVGIGIAAPNATVLGVKAGTSTNDAAVGGVLYETTTQAANVGAGEDVLASYSVPANTLAVNGQSIWFEAWGTLASNANSKVARVRFGTSGTNLVATHTSMGGQSGTWVIKGRVIRTGAATQKGYSTQFWGQTIENQSSTALAQTLSGAITFQISGEAVSNNDIILEGMVVGYDDANS